MTGAALLARRAEVLAGLARWYRDHADRAEGPRAQALRATTRDMEAEAIRTTMAAAGA